MSRELHQILTLAASRVGWRWRPGQVHRPWDLWVFGVRHPDRKPDAWDDLVGVAYVDGAGERQVEVWRATTDPGVPWLRSPMNEAGTAVLVPGQHRGAFRLGTFRDRPALRQAKPLHVFRDADGDDHAEHGPSVAVGMWGLHIHAPWRNGLKRVGRASAGCQVLHETKAMDRLVELVERQAAAGLGSHVSYSLWAPDHGDPLLSLFDHLPGAERAEA